MTVARSLAATIYWRFGLDPSRLIHDRTARPWHLAEGRPLRGLFTRHPDG